jgi:hypothetical protein
VFATTIGVVTIVVYIFGFKLPGGMLRQFGVLSDLISTGAPAFDRTADSLCLETRRMPSLQDLEMDGTTQRGKADRFRGRIS